MGSDESWQERRSSQDTTCAIISTSGTIARHEVAYLVPMPWWERPVRVELWVARTGRSSIEVHHQVRGPSGVSDTLYARSVSAIVYLDPASGRPRALCGEERDALAALADEPLLLRGSLARA